MKQRFLTKLILASCVLAASPAVFAGFYTYSNDWPDDAAVVDEKITTPAATQASAAPPPDEQNFMVVTDSEQAKRLDQYRRLYGKIGITFLATQLRKMQNTSQSSQLQNATLIVPSVNDNYVSWEVGLGTKLKYIRTELEYLYQKKMYYDASPLYAGHKGAVYSYLNSQSAWLNILYDLERLNVPYFTPYFGGLVGFVWNKTRTSITTNNNGAAKNHNRYGVGWGVTVGARLPFWTRWFGYLAYKYLDEGVPRWQSSSGTASFKGHYVVQGVELGVQYLLG